MRGSREGSQASKRSSSASKARRHWAASSSGSHCNIYDTGPVNGDLTHLAGFYPVSRAGSPDFAQRKEGTAG